jgi:hypothetical protein
MEFHDYHEPAAYSSTKPLFPAGLVKLEESNNTSYPSKSDAR